MTKNSTQKYKPKTSQTTKPYTAQFFTSYHIGLYALSTQFQTMVLKYVLQASSHKKNILDCRKPPF